MTKLQTRTLLVAGLVAASLALLWLNQQGTLDPVKDVVLIPITTLQQGVAQAWRGATRVFQNNPDAEALRQRNTELEEQLAAAQARIAQLEENQAELNHLAGLLDYARTQPTNQYLAANVIGQDPSPFLGYLILDRGSDAGIQRGMPVVGAGGLVGQIVEVTSAASKVLLITDPTSAVNARAQSSRALGIVVGQLAGGLSLQNIAQEAEVKPGDSVVTSGLGGKFPEGILIGTVNAVQRQEYEVQQNASLTPATNFAGLEIVLIIINFTPIDFSPFEGGTP
jgi:rod shape-determining protein MreC